MCAMIPTRPIVLHISRDDYQGTLCGHREPTTTLHTADAAETLAARHDLTTCDRCREAAQEGER